MTEGQNLLTIMAYSSDSSTEEVESDGQVSSNSEPKAYCLFVCEITDTHFPNCMLLIFLITMTQYLKKVTLKINISPLISKTNLKITQ